MTHKKQINKFDLIKIQSSLWKILLKGGKDQLQIGENIFANHISDKGVAFRIYKEISNLNNTKTTKFFKRQRYEQTLNQKKIHIVYRWHDCLHRKFQKSLKKNKTKLLELIKLLERYRIQG